MQKTNVACIITDHNITVNYEGQTHTVSRTDPLAENIISALKSGDRSSIPELISAKKRVEAASKGAFSVTDGQLTVDGQPVPAALYRKIMQFKQEDLPFDYLVKFAKRLNKNPSFRAVAELFQFLEKNDHPITESGCFIAYKKVRENFKDVHSGTFDNSPGKVLEVPRNQVDENSERVCSNGLHVANFDYATNFYAGGKMLEVEVDPEHVVAIPSDYNQAKMRVSKYVVLGEVSEESSGRVKVTNSTEYQDEDEEEDEEDCDVNGNCYSGYCGECFLCEDEADAEEEEEDTYPWKDEV